MEYYYRSTLKKLTSGYYFENFGLGFRCIFRELHKPNNLEELREILRQAKSNKKKIHIIGSGLSPSGLNLTDEAVISLEKFNKVIDIDLDNKIVTCQAGLVLRDFLKILDKHGLALMNTGSICDQTLAGLFATGSHGSSAYQDLLNDWLLEFTLMTTDGILRICSLDTEPRLYRAALIGLGAFGVIVEVKIRVRESFMIESTQYSTTIDEFLDQIDSLALWKSADFVRAMYYPIAEEVIIFKGNIMSTDNVKSEEKIKVVDSKLTKVWKSFYNYFVFISYEALLVIPIFFRRSNRFMQQFILKYLKFIGSYPPEDPNKSFNKLLVNCYFQQDTIEYFVPLDRCKDAIKEIRDLFNENIEFDKNHAAYQNNAGIEIRIICSEKPENQKAILSPVYQPGYYVVIGAISYKPFGMHNNSSEYFDKFEDIMLNSKGRSHWAKQFKSSFKELEIQYPEFNEWIDIRNELDPEGILLNPYLEKLINQD